jgi:hypothetical protein
MSRRADEAIKKCLAYFSAYPALPGDNYYGERFYIGLVSA